MKEQIIAYTTDFFTNLGVKVEKIDILENPNYFDIHLSTPDSGILIGAQGNTLNSLKTILKRLISNKFGSEIKISFDVNDYNKEKESRLFRIVDDKIALLDKYGQTVTFGDLNAYERKKVHSYVYGLPRKNLVTKSVGEGENRKLTLSKLEVKLSIDINSNDI